MNAIDWKALDRHWNCRLTTRGRKSGEPRTVTIWYALGDGKIFLTGDKKGPHWLRNARDFVDAEKVGGLRHLVVRYEDLIRDREDDHPELARLMRFLELPLGPAVFEALRTRAGKGTPAPLTREQHVVVEKLTAEDIVNLSAYTASRPPAGGQRSN